MDKFSGKKQIIPLPQGEVYSRLSNLGSFQQYLEMLPADVKAKVGEVRFTDDAIFINTGIAGEVELRLTGRNEPEQLVFEAIGSPVPLKVNINIGKDGDNKSMLTPVIECDVPTMLRPFVSPKMQKTADMMSDMLGNLLGARRD